MMKAKQRLFLTSDKSKLVAQDDKRAATLYAAVGDEIPDSAAKKFGLKDGLLKGSKKPSGGASDEGGATALTDLPGIGAATAKSLAAAGLDSVAKLAAVDPESPPEVSGLSPAFKWADVIAAAKGAASKDAG